MSKYYLESCDEFTFPSGTFRSGLLVVLAVKVRIDTRFLANAWRFIPNAENWR